MTARKWTGDAFQPSAPFKIGELVKVIAFNDQRKGRFAIVASEYYRSRHGLMVDVMIGEKTHSISPYYLERVNND